MTPLASDESSRSPTHRELQGRTAATSRDPLFAAFCLVDLMLHPIPVLTRGQISLGFFFFEVSRMTGRETSLRWAASKDTWSRHTHLQTCSSAPPSTEQSLPLIGHHAERFMILFVKRCCDGASGRDRAICRCFCSDGEKMKQ